MGLRSWWHKRKRAQKFSGNKDNDGSGLGKLSDQQYEKDMINARLGVVYLFSKVEVRSKILDELLSGASNIAWWTSGSSLQKSAFGEGGKALFGKENAFGTRTVAVGTGYATGMVTSTYHAARDNFAWDDIKSGFKRDEAPWYQKVLEWLTNFAKDIWDQIVKKIKAWKTTSFSIIKTFIIQAARVIFKSASTYIIQGVGFLQGLWKAGKAVCQKFGFMIESFGTELQSGHPTVIYQALQKAFTGSLLAGLFTMTKSAVNIGLAATGVGAVATAVVNIVSSALEMIIRLIVRIHEMNVCNEFIEICKDGFEKRNGPGAIHDDEQMFANIFRSYAMRVPVIAAVTLNSGICGDKMRFLKMFDGGEGERGYITQSAFDAGVRFVDGLKQAAKEYTDGAGYYFVSSDRMVHSLVKSPGVMVSHGKLYKGVDLVING